MSPSIQIIYLNGASSSGKTTLAKALQEALEQPFLHISLDRVIGMMPEKMNDWHGGPSALGFSWKTSQDATGAMIQEIQVGPFAREMVDTFQALVLTLARRHHFLIIDDVSFGKEQVDKWKELLKNYSVLWVAVKTPLEVLEARERARNNRMQGSARAQSAKVHTDVVYDLECDTHKESLNTIVKRIKEAIV